MANIGQIDQGHAHVLDYSCNRVDNQIYCTLVAAL